MPGGGSIYIVLFFIYVGLFGGRNVSVLYAWPLRDTARIYR